MNATAATIAEFYAAEASAGAPLATVRLKARVAAGSAGVDADEAEALLQSMVDAHKVNTAPAAPHFEPMTEYGNCRRIVAFARGRLRYCAALGFVVWNGKRWKVDDTGAAERFAQDAALRIFDEAKRAAAAGSALADDLTAWALRSQKGSVLASSLALAKSQLEVVVDVEAFDAHPYLLNVENGTIDLRTGRLRPHSMGDMLTKIAPVSFDPAATCPEWDRFLERVQPSAEMRNYLARWAGYCLVGDPSEQTMDLHYGLGANGKSTLDETLLGMLGDYGVTTPFETFTSKRDGGQASNDLAALAGARLVVASEPPQGARLNVAVIKQLTGGDRVTARRLYREFTTFTPQFRIALVTNHRPAIPEGTQAAWRRVHLVPWNVTIPPAERDKGLRAKLRAEWAGILAWAVRGCLEWQRVGLCPPEEIRAATEAYQRDEDPVAAFLADACDEGPGRLARSGDIVEAYARWAGQNDLPALSARALGPMLRDRGFRPAKELGERCWRGLSIRPAQDTSDTLDSDSGNFPHTHAREGGLGELPSKVSEASTGCAGFTREPGDDDGDGA